MDNVFAEILKNLILGGFLGLFEPSEPILFSKTGLHQFSEFMMSNFMEIN